MSGKLFRVFIAKNVEMPLSLEKNMKTNIKANIASVLLLLLVLCGGRAIAQLRPEAEARRQLVLAQANMEKENWTEARENMEAILDLDVDVPAEFYYHYARALERTKSLAKAREVLSIYLNDEDALSHESYNDGLKLLNAIEAGISEEKKLAEERRRSEALVQQKTAEAESGNTAAQYELAEWFRLGTNGAEKDAEKAAKWYMEVAKKKGELGAKALYHMGEMWKQYDGRLQASFYREAALLGNADALKKTGMTLEVLKYTILAEAGFSWGQYKIGNWYYYGTNGLSQNYAEALKWYTQAAKHNTEAGAKAMNDIGVMYDKGHGVEKNKEVALQWYLKAAALGNEYALSNLGAIYYNGNVVRKNKTLAKDYYIKAVWAGKSDVATKLQSLFGMKLTKLMKHTLAEAKKGNFEAQYRLGIWYRDGNGLKQDYAEARQWFELAAQHGTAVGATAMNALGLMYYEGQGVEKNYEEAHQWFLKAAALGNKYGLYNMGRCYQNGHGVEKDLVKALAYYKQAFLAGNEGVLPTLEKDFGLTAFDLAAEHQAQ